MRATDRRGVALLAALGVFAILGLLASAFLAHMKLESAYAAKDADQLKAHYLAVAGVEDAIGRLQADSSLVDAYTDGWWLGESPEMRPFGEGGYTVTVTDESARLNILAAPPQALSAILGGDKEAVASLANFRSSRRLFSVEDLGAANLGANAFARLSALGTVLGDGKVNINTANADVIAALPGMDPEAARQVVEFRKGKDGVEATEDDFVFASPKDISKAPGLTPVRIAPAMPFIKTNSDTFRVESVGSVYLGPRLVSNEKIVVVLRRDTDQNVNILSWEGS